MFLFEYTSIKISILHFSISKKKERRRSGVVVIRGPIDDNYLSLRWVSFFSIRILS